MPVPSYLVDQEEQYITSRGYTFRDFSADQILSELTNCQLKSGQVLLGEITYQQFVDARYESQGFVKTKSTSIAGGYMWKQPSNH